MTFTRMEGGHLAEADRCKKAWTPAQTLGFILVTCGGFWVVVGALVFRAVPLG